MSRPSGKFRIVALGVSTGGVEGLQTLLGGLPGDFPLPLLVVHHISPDAPSDLARLLEQRSEVKVKEADAEEAIAPGTVYLAPANYHLLVETSGCLALTVDPPVNFARPSVDVLFDSVAEAFGPTAIGVILTGAGADGSRGLQAIKERYGLAIVQDPEDAVMDAMPRNALARVRADHVLPLDEIAQQLCRLAGNAQPQREGK